MISGGNRYPWSLSVSPFIDQVCHVPTELDSALLHLGRQNDVVLTVVLRAFWAVGVVEVGFFTVWPLPMTQSPPACPILDQHRGAGSSSDQTTRDGQAGLSCIPRGAANDPRIGGHAHDPEGAGEVGERFGCSATDSVHQEAVRGGCMRQRLLDPTHRSPASF